MSILPMLATPTTASSGRNPESLETLLARGDWILDTKLDGVRCLAEWDGSSITLRNRNNRPINNRYPDVATELTRVLAEQPAFVLDGEIVAMDGSFETALLRDKQENGFRISQLVRSHPVMFVAFDLPSYHHPWRERRHALELLAELTGLQITPVGETLEFFEQVKALGMEGVIAKNVHSTYEAGRRSPQWRKYKNLHRVTCLVAGYTEGTGSRAEFGAMLLALIDQDGELTPVGRVGSGFTEREIKFLKLALDRGDLLTVEVECLGVTSGGQLRMPIYIDVRTDVDLRDCTVAQLEPVPRCGS